MTKGFTVRRLCWYHNILKIQFHSELHPRITISIFASHRYTVPSHRKKSSTTPTVLLENCTSDVIHFCLCWRHHMYNWHYTFTPIAHSYYGHKDQLLRQEIIRPPFTLHLCSQNSEGKWHRVELSSQVNVEKFWCYEDASLFCSYCKSGIPLRNGWLFSLWSLNFYGTSWWFINFLHLHRWDDQKIMVLNKIWRSANSKQEGRIYMRNVIILAEKATSRRSSLTVQCKKENVNHVQQHCHSNILFTTSSTQPRHHNVSRTSRRHFQPRFFLSRKQSGESLHLQYQRKPGTTTSRTHPFDTRWSNCDRSRRWIDRASCAVATFVFVRDSACTTGIALSHR